MNLEKLLLDINGITTLKEEQKKEVLKNTMREEISAIAKDALLTEKVNAKSPSNLLIEEEVVDANGNVVDPEESGESAAEQGMEDMTNGEESEENMPTDVMPTDMDATAPTDDTTMMDDDDEVIDLTGASIDEVLAALQNLPDDAVIQIQKNPPTFDVKDDASGATGMTADLDTMSDGGTDADTSGDMGDLDLEESWNELDEMVNNMDEAVNVAATKKLLKEYETVLTAYENKMKKYESVLKEQESKITVLEENEKKYLSILTESKNALDTLMVHNTNLMHISNLFTEQNLSLTDKENVLIKFDNVQTINESKILFDVLKENYSERKSNGNGLKQKINESPKPKVLLQEQRTFVDPQMDRFMKIVKHKI